jgi:hypothetical protein
MIALFEKLNPMKYNKNEKVFGELDEVNEVFFVMQGTYRIGYEINKKEYFNLAMREGTMIGGFECSMDKRSCLVYRTQTKVKGFFITNKEWKNLQTQFPEFMKPMVQKLTSWYMKINTYLKAKKNVIIKDFDRRADFKQFLVLCDYDPTEMKEILVKTFAIEPK